MNRSIRNALTLATSLALLAVTGGAAVADHGDHGRKHRFHRGAGMHEAADPERMLRHLTRKLELDDTQRQQIENIVTAAKPEMEALRERSASNREAMRELDSGDGNYEARLNELALEKGSIASEQALLHGRVKSEIDAVLTPEQRRQLEDSAAKMRERMSKRADGRSRS